MTALKGYEENSFSVFPSPGRCPGTIGRSPGHIPCFPLIWEAPARLDQRADTAEATSRASLSAVISRTMVRSLTSRPVISDDGIKLQRLQASRKITGRRATCCRMTGREQGTRDNGPGMKGRCRAGGIRAEMIFRTWETASSGVHEKRSMQHRGTSRDAAAPGKGEKRHENTGTPSGHHS